MDKKVAGLLILFFLSYSADSTDLISLHYASLDSNVINMDDSQKENPYRRRRMFLIPGAITFIPSVYLLGKSIHEYGLLKEMFEQDKSEGKAIDLLFLMAPVCGIVAGSIATAGSTFCIIFGSLNWHAYNNYNRNAVKLALLLDF